MKNALSSPEVVPSTGRRSRTKAYRTLGDWQLVQQAGEGRFAQVFFARPTGVTDERCDYAIKQLRPEFSECRPTVAQFQLEAALGTSIADPHLITVLSAEVVTAPHYMVLPRLRGMTVAELMSTRGRLELPQALWIARQVACALSALHSAGWIHADVKSENVFVAADGHVTLFDLGLAVAISQESASLDESLRGTLDYAAPESFTSTRRLGPASDVYSLGVLLYEMLAGCRPFSRPTPAKTVEAHLHEVAPSLRTHLRQAPREVAQLVARMMSKEPVRRPGASGDLQDRLARLEIELFSLRQCPAGPQANRFEL